MAEKLTTDNVTFTGQIKHNDITVTFNCMVCDEPMEIYPVTCSDYIITGFGVTKICDKCKQAIMKMREEMEK